MRKHAKQNNGRREQVRATAEQIHSAAIRLLRRLRLFDISTGVGPAQLSALSVLVFGNTSLSLGDLAAAEQVRPPTMSRIVAALLDAGLVTTTAGPRRRIEIAVTERGRKLMLKGREARVNALVKAMESLTADEIDTVARASEILVSVTANIKRPQAK